MKLDSKSFTRVEGQVNMRLPQPASGPPQHSQYVAFHTPESSPDGSLDATAHPQRLAIHVTPSTEEAGRPARSRRRTRAIPIVGSGDAPVTQASGAARRLSRCKSFSNAVKASGWGLARAFVGHGLVGLAAASTGRYFAEQAVESELVSPEVAMLAAGGAALYVGMSAGAHSGELIFHRIVDHSASCKSKCGLILARSAGALVSGVVPLVTCIMVASAREKEEGNESPDARLIALALVAVLARQWAQTSRDASNVTFFQGVAGRTVPLDEKGVPLAGKKLMRFQLVALMPAMLAYAATAVVHQWLFKECLDEALTGLLGGDSEMLLAAMNVLNATNATNATQASGAAPPVHTGVSDATVKMIAFALSSMVLELLDEIYQPLSFFLVATPKGYRLDYEQGKGKAQLKANLKAFAQTDNWPQIRDHASMRIFGFAVPEALATFATIDKARSTELLILAGVTTGPVELRSHFATCGASIKAAWEEAMYELNRRSRAVSANPGEQGRAARTLDPQTATPYMAADMHFAQDRQQQLGARVKSITNLAIERMRESLTALSQTLESVGAPQKVQDEVSILLRNIDDIEDAESIATEADKLAAFSALDINPAGFDALRELLEEWNVPLPPPAWPPSDEQVGGQHPPAAEQVDLRSRSESLDYKHSEEQAPSDSSQAGRLAPVEMTGRPTRVDGSLLPPRRRAPTRELPHNTSAARSVAVRDPTAVPYTGPSLRTDPGSDD
ncbi:hypothetical protein BH11PSE7_BH11PSE7_20230 [soil metagenome]